jgi:amidase
MKKRAAADQQCRFGISFLGEKWSEAKLLGLAFAFEQKTNHAKSAKPIVMPKTELEDVLASKKSG